MHPATRLPTDRPDAGFTILEVPIALAIVAVSVVVIGSVMSTNASAVRAPENHVALVLKQFLNDRASLSNDSNAIATALGDAKASVSTRKSKAYRLLVRVRFPNGRRTVSEIVISLRGKKEPYRVLSWQDDVTTHW